MSGVIKAIGTIAAVVAVAAVVVITGGAALGAGLGVLAAAGTALEIAVGVAAVASVGSAILGKKPPTPSASPEIVKRLNANIDTTTGRKSWVGTTAGNTDIRDQEYSDDQTYLHRFLVTAAHKVHEHSELWLDDKLVWTVGGGVQGEFVGYLDVTSILEGSAGNAINISARMGTTRRYTGCAYLYLRFKLTGATTSTDSPFAQTVPTRITIRGDGAYHYDPRLDSTVSGGSGSHRADDQSTWAWDDDACRNPALQLLWFMLGWRINGLLSVGLGIPPARIDLESFITAANLCDESVSLSAGGSEPRYRSDGVWSETDDPKTVIDALKASMNADLDDVGGQLRLTVFHNDLASPIASFGPDNIIGAVSWDQTPPLHETFNIVRGSYIDPSDNSLYQPVDFPEVSLASIDDIDRIDTFPLLMVQSASQAQRLAKQRLQRQQYGGQLNTTFDVTGWKVLKNDVIELTLPVFGWTDKLFRVAEIEQGMTGEVPVVLREEHEDIYAWDEDEAPAVVAADPTTYDRALNPIIVAIGAELPAAILAVARSGTSFPTASDSAEGQLFIRTDLGFRLFQRLPGDGLISIGGVEITLSADTIYLPPWGEITDQRTIDALAAALEAQNTADAAYAAANDALDALATLADDGILTGKEKREILIPKSALLADRFTKLTDLADDLSVSHSAADTAYSDWTTFLGTLSPAWNDDTQDTPVVRVDYDGYRDALDAALELLDKALKAKAADTATWANVGGTGKPADNADVTGDNTANDTSNVNGVPSSGVTATIVALGNQVSGSAYLSLPSTTSYEVIGGTSFFAGPNGTFSLAGGGGYVDGGSGCAVDGYIEYRLGGSGGWTTLSGSTFAGGTSGGGIPQGFSFSLTPSGASIGLSGNQQVEFRVQARKSTSNSIAAVGTPFIGTGWS